MASLSFNFLNAWSKREIGWLSLFCGLGIFYVDWITGAEIHVSVFYLFPTFLVAWYIGKKSGFAYGLIASVAWTLADSLTGLRYSHVGILLWNTVMRAGFFIVLVILADRLREALLYEQSISRIDPLTSLYNSRGFYERAHHVLEALKLEKRPFTVAYIDLDNFKSVNDHEGHDAGDRVLQSVASVMLQAFGRDDIAARFGGDEFVLLTSPTGSGTPEARMELLREKLLKAMALEDWPVTFSIGVVSFHHPPASLKEVVKRVDDLMYQVKRNGKNGIKFYRFEATSSRLTQNRFEIAQSGDPLRL